MTKFSIKYFKAHWSAGLAFGTPILVYLPRIIINAPLSSGDYLSQYYLWQSFLANSLHNFDWPWWNPFLFSGTPFFTNPQSAMLFPLNWLNSAFGGNQLLPFGIFQSITALTAGVSGLGAYLLLKELDLKNKYALLGSIIWSTSTIFTNSLIDTTTGFTVASLFPLTLWVIVKTLSSKKTVWKTSVSILIALAWMGGSPSLFLPYLAGVILFWMSISWHQNIFRDQLRIMLPALLIGLSLSAIHLFPSIALLSQTGRYAQAHHSAIPEFSFFSWMLGLVVSEGSGIPWSIGIIASVASIFGIWKSRQYLKMRWLSSYLFLTAVLYLAIRFILPQFGNFPTIYNLLRYPDRWLLLPLVGLVVAASLGFQMLLERTSTSKPLRIIFLILGLFGLGISAVFETYPVTVITAAGLLLIYASAAQQSSAAKPVLLSALLVCLIYPATYHQLLNRQRIDTAKLQAVANWPVASQAYSTGGYDSIVLRRYQTFLDALPKDYSSRPGTSKSDVSTKTSLAWLPTSIINIPGQNYLVKVAESLTLLPKESYSNATDYTWPTSPGTIEVVSQKSSFFRYRVKTEKEATMVFNQNLVPGWRATINGTETDTLSINWYMMAIIVPPGEHIITFSYRPPGFIIGACVTLITSLFILFRLKGHHNYP